MRPSNRIIVNTLAQYTRTIINLLLSLYSARLVLQVLGVDDYGVYALVAGVVSMLSFITNSLVGSTQRFLSYSQGQGELLKLKDVFGKSLLLHMVLGLIIIIVLESLSPFLFNGFLNIPSGRENAAVVVYQLVLFMVYASFVTAPYRALLVSRENLIYISIIDVVDGILKVVLVIGMTYMSGDKLVLYGWMMLAISVFDLFSFAIYSHIKYDECVVPRLRNFSISYIKEFSSYTGWVIYSSGSLALRNQGLAIVLNNVLGAAINAAYGIGAQISGMVSFVSLSLNNAIAPQLMAAEGSGDREHMWLLAKIESKFSFLLLALVGIPVLFEMQTLLELWLGEVPPNTMLFGCTFLSMQIIDMLTTGLGLANRAIGNIGKYTLYTYTPKLLILPFGWVLLNNGISLLAICVMMVVIETICMIIRIPLLRKEKGFCSRSFVYDVIFKSLPPSIISVITCFVICHFLHNPYRLFVTFSVSGFLFGIVAFYVSLVENERKKVLSIVNNIFIKLRTR